MSPPQIHRPPQAREKPSPARLGSAPGASASSRASSTQQGCCSCAPSSSHSPGTASGAAHRYIKTATGCASAPCEGLCADRQLSLPLSFQGALCLQGSQAAVSTLSCFAPKQPPDGEVHHSTASLPAPQISSSLWRLSDAPCSGRQSSQLWRAANNQRNPRNLRFRISSVSHAGENVPSDSRAQQMCMVLMLMP